jgi:hypothetical protein
VSDILLLDSGPLGLITQPQRSHEVIAITDWLKDCLGAGAPVVLLAAQARRMGIAAVIATTNQKHLLQFISARHWRNIEPMMFANSAEIGPSAICSERKQMPRAFPAVENK